jgi:lipoprotein-releasing system ATP-binding protein
MEQIIIQTKNINKSYSNGQEKLKVLKGFDFSLKKKEIISIMGDSGCGKSTALNILGTLDKPDSGHLIINGEEVDYSNNKKLSKIRNEEIGFVFQFHFLLPEFTALENVLIPTWIKGTSNNLNYAKDLFSDLGLINKINSYPSQLSGGERSRVALIRGIINKPNILFADEPTGNLDKENADKLIELLIKINKDYGQSIVLTTHNPDVANIGKRRYKLQNGKLE